MDDKLYELLEQLPSRNLIHLMWAALEEMHAYNGRSRTHCICLAMGCKPDDPNQPTKWMTPSLPKIIKKTEQMGL